MALGEHIWPIRASLGECKALAEVAAADWRNFLAHRTDPIISPRAASPSPLPTRTRTLVGMDRNLIKAAIAQIEMTISRTEVVISSQAARIMDLEQSWRRSDGAKEPLFTFEECQRARIAIRDSLQRSLLYAAWP